MDAGDVRMQEVADAAVAMVRTAADAKGITVFTSYDDVPVIVADNPMQCVAIGAGLTLEDRVLRGALQPA